MPSIGNIIDHTDIGRAPYGGQRLFLAVRSIIWA
jgi:hypothetical protein